MIGGIDVESCLDVRDDDDLGPHLRGRDQSSLKYVQPTCTYSRDGESHISSNQHVNIQSGALEKTDGSNHWIAALVEASCKAFGITNAVEHDPGHGGDRVVRSSAGPIQGITIPAFPFRLRAPVLSTGHIASRQPSTELVGGLVLFMPAPFPEGLATGTYQPPVYERGNPGIGTVAR